MKGFIVSVFLLFSLSCSSPHDSPESVVREFYKNIELDKTKRNIPLLVPELSHRHATNPRFYKSWVGLRAACKIRNYGGVKKLKKPLHPSVSESVELSVTYDCLGNKMNGAIKLSKLNGKWYWHDL